MGRRSLTAILLDTHVWAWSLTGDRRLTARALASVVDADDVFVSPISFFEIAQKVRLGKWPEMEGFIDQLPGLLRKQGGVIAEFGPAICLEAGLLNWIHRDPFDRLIAATARCGALPLISADPVFDEVVTRVW